MAETNTASDTGDIKPNSFIQQIDELRNSVQMALKFERTYEFHVKNSKVEIAETKPLILHSWTSVDRPSRRANKLQSYRLSTESRHSVELPLGVTAVLGRSGSGKTRFTLEHLFATNDALEKGTFQYVKMFEPGDDDRLEAISKNVTIPLFEADFALSFAKQLIDPKVDVIIVDSLRYLFYSSSGGATGKGGVNMSLFMDLTHLDGVATALGKRVIVVINPMTDDEAAFNFYVEAAVGAVSGVIAMKDAFNASVTTRYAPTRDMVALKFPRTTRFDDPTYGRGASNAVDTIKVSGGKTDDLSAQLFDRR